MKERPILFSAPMVLAIQAGRKTQTRRIVNRLLGYGNITEFGPSDTPGYDWRFRDKRLRWNELTHDQLLAACPYGQPGDRLWVREATWFRKSDGITSYADGSFRLHPSSRLGPKYFHADKPPEDDWPNNYRQYGYKAVPTIHMPRWASRINLTVKSVRVQRLQDISERDAEAEGVPRIDNPDYDSVDPMDDPELSYRAGFAAIWNSINGDGAWEANPWVWVVEFE